MDSKDVSNTHMEIAIQPQANIQLLLSLPHQKPIYAGADPGFG